MHEPPCQGLAFQGLAFQELAFQGLGVPGAGMPRPAVRCHHSPTQAGPRGCHCHCPAVAQPSFIPKALGFTRAKAGPGCDHAFPKPAHWGHQCCCSATCGLPTGFPPSLCPTPQGWSQSPIRSSLELSGMSLTGPNSLLWGELRVCCCSLRILAGFYLLRGTPARALGHPSAAGQSTAAGVTPAASTGACGAELVLYFSCLWLILSPWDTALLWQRELC